MSSCAEDIRRIHHLKHKTGTVFSLPLTYSKSTLCYLTIFSSASMQASVPLPKPLLCLITHPLQPSLHLSRKLLRKNSTEDVTLVLFPEPKQNTSSAHSSPHLCHLPLNWISIVSFRISHFLTLLCQPSHPLIIPLTQTCIPVRGESSPPYASLSGDSLRDLKLRYETSQRPTAQSQSLLRSGRGLSSDSQGKTSSLLTPAIALALQHQQVHMALSQMPEPTSPELLGLVPYQNGWTTTYSSVSSDNIYENTTTNGGNGAPPSEPTVADSTTGDASGIEETQ
jgi:hypothetical protein